MEIICDSNKCSGCSACMNACPKGCISMEFDEYGVLQPVINQELCVDCGLCKKVCPVVNKQEGNRPQTAYAAWHLDDEIHKTSASGGMAIALYEKAIENGGVGFGTKFIEDLQLKIVSADTLEGVRAFRGSKYVQASVGMSFKEAKKELDNGRQVVYIGTPCQIAGLKGYLRKEYDNLITVDLICHGVPSIKHLKNHVEYIENKTNKKADRVTFRGEYSFRMVLYNKDEIIYNKDRFLDSYFTGFLNGLFYRPNCYECPYACDKRISDITIGDFWGLGNEAPCSYNLNGGVSVVLPNTDKGHAFVKSLNGKIFMEERPLTEAINGNDQLRHPSERHKDYENFREMYKTEGFETAAFEYTKTDILAYKKELIKKKMKRIPGKVKRVCKKIIGK